MQYYRCKIRSMNKEQQKQLGEFCLALGIEAEITPIKPVGQPSKIDKSEFLAEYRKYIAGEIAPKDMMFKFDLSKSGFYNKLKTLNLPDKKAYMDANKVINQQTMPSLVQPIQQVTHIENFPEQEFEGDSFGIYGDSLERETHLEDDCGLELYEDCELELEDDI